MLSVVIPVHGRCSLFLETLQSLKEQDLDGFTLIVSDDSPCPKDRATIRKATEDYQSQIKRPSQYLFTQPNLGQARNTNQGLKHIKTPYARILHSDDLLAPNTLSHELKILKTPQNNTALLFHETLPFKTTHPTFQKNPALHFVSPKKYFWEHLHSSTPVPSAFIFATETLKEMGLLNEDFKFLCDWEFSFRLLQRAHQQSQTVALLSKGLVAWRTHPHSASARLWNIHFSEHHRLTQTLLHSLKYENSDFLSSDKTSIFLKTSINYRYERILKDFLTTPFNHKLPFNALKFFRCLLSPLSLIHLVCFNLKCPHQKPSLNKEPFSPFKTLFIKVVMTLAAKHHSSRNKK